MSDLTRDQIANSRLTLLQRKEGYRVGVDAILLATDLPDFDPGGTVVELGAGQGAVALCVAARHPQLQEVVAVERQDSLFELLERNIALNELQGRMRAVHGDIREYRELFEPHSATLVVCNPPYFVEGQRRPGNDAERAGARHELAGTLKDFVQAAAYVLEQRGRLKIILPPLRLGDLHAAVGATDLSFETMRYFHSRDHSDAYLVESVLRRGGAPDLKVRPPLILYDGDSSIYGAEVQRRIDAAARPPEEET